MSQFSLSTCCFNFIHPVVFYTLTSSCFWDLLSPFPAVTGWKQSYTLDKSLGTGSQRGINKNKQPFTLTHTHTDSSEITVAEDCSKPDCLAESSSISRTHIQATKPLLIFIVCMVLLLLAHKLLILLLLLLGRHKFLCLWINQVYFLLHAYCWPVGNCRRIEPVRGPSSGMEHTTFILWGDTANRCTGWFNLPINKQDEEYVLYPCCFVPWPDRLAAPWQSHCAMPCWGLGLSHSFYVTYGPSCPHKLVSARHSKGSCWVFLLLPRWPIWVEVLREAARRPQVSAMWLPFE